MKKSNKLLLSSPLKVYVPGGGSLGGSVAMGGGAGGGAAASNDGLNSWVQNNVLSPVNVVTPVNQNTTTTPIATFGQNYDPTIFTYVDRPVYLEERHMSVIRKGPTTPPALQMYSYTQPDLNDDNKVDVVGSFGGITCENPGSSLDPTNTVAYNDGCLEDDGYPNGFNPLGATWEDPNSPGIHNSIFYTTYGTLYEAGDEIVIPINHEESGEDWAEGDKLNITGKYFNSFGNLNTCGISGIITNLTSQVGTRIRLTSISPSTPKSVGAADVYTVSLVQKPPMFELKFPRFSYRYKYEDGEYSVFAPWSEVAFIPGDFDYLPKKGYNLGMTNLVRSLDVLNWIPKNIPKDVVQVDLLYKESNSPNVYTIESFKKDDPLPDGSTNTNYWNTPGTGENFGKYTITTELIHKTLPSNQLLRPWDNVPRKALAQEITANRLIYANYLQNYNINDDFGSDIKPIFSINIDSVDITSATSGGVGEDLKGKPAKSLKSMRTYQLGVVYRDRYGRETPVLTSQSGSIKISKEKAKTINKFSVALSETQNGEPNYPEWAESFTFYIKETSNEYYNVAMDRWYNADDGGVWLSFPSSERNKINEDTFLILKKEHDTNMPVDEETKYKVVAIENNAPTFIKTENQYWGSLAMMLPPPGWGTGSKPGGWEAGMFSPSGLPLPNHQYLDIYKEYWDQSVFATLKEKPTCQIRLVQAPGMKSAYSASGNAATNYSEWYDVASISSIGQPPEVIDQETLQFDSAGNVIGSTIEEVELPATEIQLTRITLEKILGNELEFARATDILDLSRGLMLEARTQIIKDKSQFEGRFFVKVERDAVIENHVIAPQAQLNEDWQVIMSRPVSYLAAAHPGRQDWNHDVYVPFQGESINAFSSGSQNVPATSYNAVPVELTSVTQSSPITPKLISSYHAHAGFGAVCLTTAGVPIEIPSGSSWHACDGTGNAAGSSILWPLGPGPKESPIPHCPNVGGNVSPGDGWLSNSFAGALGFGGSSKIISGLSYHEWPSYTPSEHVPGYGAMTFGTGAIFAHGKIDNALITGSFVEPTNWNGYNHFHKAAIWDSGKGSRHGGDPIPTSGWNADTIMELAGAWDDLIVGRRHNYHWPLATGWKRWFIDKVGAAKGYSGAGIYENASGNVSKIDLAYYGVGSGSGQGSRDFEMGTYQYDEARFAELIGQTGTSFRFKQDPDQIVYTVTEVKQQTVYNYEAPCGTWGWRDGLSESYMIDDPTASPGDPQISNGLTWGEYDGGRGHEGMEGRGQGCAESLWPVYGPANIHPQGMAGKDAFMSDFILKEHAATTGLSNLNKFSGGSYRNRRIRYTLTLNKKIGEGPHGFHPITHHCAYDQAEDEYYANVEGSNGGPLQEYSVDKTVRGNGSATEVNGGTATGWKGYNLSSYWNRTAGVPSNDMATKAGCDAGQTVYEPVDAGQHVGLHERGLNHTTIEIVSQYTGDEADTPMSNNPAVWETEPKEDVGLDIYYAASPTYPITLDRWRNDVDEENGWYDYSDRGEEYISVGSVCNISGNSITSFVDGVQGNLIWLNTHVYEDATGAPDLIPLIDASTGEPTKLIFTSFKSGKFYGAFEDTEKIEATIKKVHTENLFEIEPLVHNERRTLGYFNCFSFSNGVESNRIRDDYNAVTIDKGVKASMPLATPYEEERRYSGLIFSGIYNSTSGINETNQFIQAEPITKDLNPINGSIQKLFARDTDLVTFCENKVFKILAKKDALFNADGNTNVTSNAAVLGQSIPFTGEFGISKNPESFASESYRIYFTDKARGAVLRLSRDGITPISDKGMKDWFKDNLEWATNLIGSFDDRKDQYNLTVEVNSPDDGNYAHTLSYTESRKGWVSFKSFIHEDGFSYKNNYYTIPSNEYNNKGWDTSPFDFRYGSQVGNAEVWKHHVDLEIEELVLNAVENDSTVELNDASRIEVGMNVLGNGVPIDTVVVEVSDPLAVSQYVVLSSNVWIYQGEVLKFLSARNNFYTTQAHSMVTVMFNGDQGSVKRFRTLNYEGTQAETTYNANNLFYLYDTNNAVNAAQGEAVGQIYYDNYPKNGWKVSKMETDMQQGLLSEFIDKENKWFNYIRGLEDAGEGDNIDTAEFSLQGLGRRTLITSTPDTNGCMDPSALNYDPSATQPCYNCCLYTQGCDDPNATNYDPTADTPCNHGAAYRGCCQYISG